MSKTPDRRRREGPAKSEAQRGLLSGGPWPNQVHRAPGPSTSRPKAEGPFLWWVPPRVHGAGSSAVSVVSCESQLLEQPTLNFGPYQHPTSVPPNKPSVDVFLVDHQTSHNPACDF